MDEPPRRSVLLRYALFPELLRGMAGEGGTSDRGVRGGLRGDGRSYGRLKAVSSICVLCASSQVCCLNASGF